MKNLLFIAFVLSVLASCEPDEPVPNPHNVVASCSFEVDSMLVVCDTSGFHGINATGFSQSLSLTVARDSSFKVNLDILEDAKVGEFDLPAVRPSGYPVAASYSIIDTSYESGRCKTWGFGDSTYSAGKVIITKIERSGGIARVSGTFYFDACGSYKLHKVRNGKFENLLVQVY